jgi:hypothetical protein
MANAAAGDWQLSAAAVAEVTAIAVHGHERERGETTAGGHE